MALRACGAGVCIMPSLYQSSIEKPISLLGFNHHTLQLTAVLLREPQPALANSLTKLLQEQPLYREQRIDVYELFNCLGATQIGDIIASLTEIGNGWLNTPLHSQQSIQSIHKLLNEWIKLAEWIIQHGEIH
ncbi:hypothetical protein [Gilvimarinus chinensis]|uniref:hypothetical protein n=1 Tax=Gilvimarinus chinensis TaxID=396005 RepID=UPI00036F8788|nr:hypothetical protein [Gilvimarinus chinensis]